MKMVEHDIQFENMGFTDSTEADGHALSEADLETLNIRAAAEGWFPPYVTAIAQAYVTEDDHQPNTDKKVFVCVKLRVKLDQSRDPETVSPPGHLLDKVVNELLRIGRSTPLPIALENAWENVDQEAVAPVVGTRPRRAP